MYEFFLAVHILCAVLWVGGGVMLHVLGRRAVKAGPEAAVAFSKEGSWVGGRLIPPLTLLLLIFGILLVGETPYDHSDPWISFAYLVWFVTGVFGVVVYPKMQKKIDAAAAEHGASSREAADQVRTFLNVNTIEITLLLLVVIDMAVKPGA